MRIISGNFKGKKLLISKDKHTRPLKDNVKESIFNILEHSLVPPHKILTDDEKKKVYKQYNITNDSQFPEISRFDPVASALGMRPGDLCKIERPSPTAITSTYYRLCIH